MAPLLRSGRLIAITAALLLGAASGRILQQEMVGQVGDLENVPDSNESLVVPTYTFDLEVPALAPASAPILQQLLAPISAPQATESEFLQVVSGRRLKQVLANVPSLSASPESLAPLAALAASVSPAVLETGRTQAVAPTAACRPLADILAAPDLRQFQVLASGVGDLDSELAALGSDNFTVLVPDNTALAAALAANPRGAAALSDTAAVRQLLAQNLALGKLTAGNLQDGQLLQTRLQQAPLTVTRSGTDVALLTGGGQRAGVMRGEVSCTVNVLVTDALLVASPSFTAG